MMRAGIIVAAVCLLAIVVAGILTAMGNSCPVTYGDPRRGEALVASYGCLACHDRGRVGPPLKLMAKRAYIAGRYPNIQIWMIEWIEHPQRLAPGTAMPDLGVGERDARDIAAYLATLR